MLSILIPVYNHYITDLVEELDSQAKAEGIEYEILIIDDDSSSNYKLKNRELQGIQTVRYVELDKNIGRSKIRNKLFYLSKYDYLLFMDCDAKIKGRDYIKNYIKNCNGCVVCGGTCYEPESPPHQYTLRWYYGKKRETKRAAVRNQNPNNSFTTFNFLIPKEIFGRINFDETLNRYGHEDTLFGYELKKNNFVVKHIDNPLIHTGLDTNKDFVFKTKQSVKNLYAIALSNNDLEQDICKDVKILQYYKAIKSIGLVNIISFVFKLTHRIIEERLINKSPKLFYIDLLKLGYLCTLRK